MKHTNKNKVSAVKVLNGIYRKTLSFNRDVMICHFFLENKSEVPLHSHEQNQIGYVIRGKIKFITEDSEFIAEEGEGYVFDSNEKHGAILMADSEVIEVFNPVREDYK